MSANSKIEWTDHTFNPWEGCTKKSPGCKNCYAEARNKRFASGKNWGKGKPRRRTSVANWRAPLQWNKAAICTNCGHAELLGSDDCRNCGRNFSTQNRRRPRVFCASISDWLDPEVSWQWRRDLLALIRATPNLDWILLTKNPEHWRRLMGDVERNLDGPGTIITDWFWLFAWVHYGKAPNNVWMLTSVEDQPRADERIRELLQIPAKIHGLSCEPLLEAVDLTEVTITVAPGFFGDCLQWHHRGKCHEAEGIAYPTIDWVIVGGESGPGARACHLNWMRSIVSQCLQARVPVFVKQVGSLPVFDRDEAKLFIRDKKGGNPAEWPEDLRIREFPRVAQASGLQEHASEDARATL